MPKLRIVTLTIALVCFGISLHAQVVPYRKGELWGLSDKSGKTVLPYVYSDVSVLTSGYFSIYQDGYYGMADPQGNIIIKPSYYSLYDGGEGCFIASNEDYKYGVLDAKGNVMVPFRYSNIGTFNNGVALASTYDADYNEEIELISKTGKVIKKIKGGYYPGYFGDEYYTDSFNDLGYKVISDASSYLNGLLDSKGKMILKPVYGSIYSPKEGLFIVTDSTYKYGAVNSKGKVVIPFKYDYLSNPSEGLILASKDYMYGYIDLKGKTVIPFLYDNAYDFKNGTAIASQSYTYAQIDKKGMPISNVFSQYSYVNQAGEYYAALKGDYMGLVDKNGNPVSAFIYDEIYYLGSNRFSVSKEGLYGMIDNTGKELIPTKYVYLGTGSDYGYDGYYMSGSAIKNITMLPVFDGIYYGYFDINGKQLTKFIYESAYEEYPAGLGYIMNTSGRYGYVDNKGKEYFEEPPIQQITVSNVSDLLDQIGSDRVITLAPGIYDLTDVEDYYNMSVTYATSYDGIAKELSVYGVANLTLRAEKPNTVEIMNTDKYANVIIWDYCYNVTLENITMGHGKEAGICEGNVIRSNGSNNLQVKGCYLYGSGALGIYANGGKNLQLSNTKITECTYGIATFEYVTNLTVENCVFENNKGYDMLTLISNNNQVFKNCIFRNNQGEKGDSYSNYSLIMLDNYYEVASFQNCTFENNQADYFVNVKSLIEETGSIEKGNTYREGRYRVEDTEY